MAHSEPPLVLRRFGLVEYRRALAAMRDFVAARGEHGKDELWLLQHPPVYTRGIRAATPTRDPAFAEIPLVASDRGGLMTYHGPGQLIAYTLFDLRRAAIGVRALVHGLEQSVIDCLAEYDISAARRAHAPGVYVDGAKIAALGLRVRRGLSYHGLSLNVDMDLAPFGAIAPCGYEGLAVTQMSALCRRAAMETVAARLATILAATFGFRLSLGSPEWGEGEGEGAQGAPFFSSKDDSAAKRCEVPTSTQRP